MSVSKTQLRDAIRQLAPWHHDVEIRPGISTWEVGAEGSFDEELGRPLRVDVAGNFSPLLRRLYPAGLAGRSFLDCACNAGGYSFAARESGAGRCFGFDARQLWIDQARLIASERQSEGMSFEVMMLADLPEAGLEQFDICFFGGIFYHLPDPAVGLRTAADLTKDLLIVNTAAVPGDGKALQLNIESTKAVLSGINGLAWLPTGPQVVMDMLAWCGFPHSRLDFLLNLPNGRDRIQIVAAREVATLADYDSAGPKAVRPWASLTRGAVKNLMARLR